MDRALTDIRKSRPIGRKRSVMIVDDDASLLRALQARCEAINIHVFAFTNMQEAIQSASAARPDLFILDVNMSSGNGLDACDDFTLSKQFRRIPIVIMTGNHDHETLERTQRAGADYVRKGAHLWNRLEPLLMERLGLESKSAA